MGRIMAVDYGERRIGIALSDPLKITAQPYDVIEVISEKKAANRIAEIVKEKEVEEVIIGLPLSSTGGDTKIGEKVKVFAELVKRRVNVPVKLVDERMTTRGAVRVLDEFGVKREKRKKIIDKLAATYLLEGYLESLR